MGRNTAEASESAISFLGKITRNLSLNRLEKYTAQKRGGGRTALALEELEECIPASNYVEQAVDDIALAEIINSFLATLTPETRKFFVRRYWYLSPVREIASDYAVNESTVKVTLMRTRNKLKKVRERRDKPMKEKRLLKVLGEIDEKYIEEAAPVEKNEGQPGICIYSDGELQQPVSAWFVSLLLQFPTYLKVSCRQYSGVTAIPMQDVGQTTDLNGEQTDGVKTAGEQESFAAISSLLTDGGHGITEQALDLGKVSIGQYMGIYEKVQSVESAILSENKGKNISGTEEWYYVSGHTDMQYLIRNNNGEYSLWKFSCFDGGEYPYSDVLELVYQIDSADAISEIVVSPANG